LEKILILARTGFMSEVGVARREVPCGIAIAK
jgi:hypothetical protein